MDQRRQRERRAESGMGHHRVERAVIVRADQIVAERGLGELLQSPERGEARDLRKGSQLPER